MRKIIKILFKCDTKELQDYMVSHFTKSALKVEKYNKLGIFGICISYAESDLEMELAVRYANKNKISTRKDYLLEFTDEELNQIPYFKLGVSETSIYGMGASSSAKYIYKDCDYCGAGAVQITPLKLPIKLLNTLGSYDIFAVPPELVVSSRIKKELKKSCVTGCEFLNIIDRKSGKQTEDFEVKINTQLPLSQTPRPMRIEKCPKCGKEGIMFTRRLQYKLSDFSEKKDFYISQESRFIEKESWRNGYRKHDIIISRKVRDILKRFDNHFIGIYPLYFEELY